MHINNACAWIYKIIFGLKVKNTNYSVQVDLKWFDQKRITWSKNCCEIQMAASNNAIIFLSIFGEAQNISDFCLKLIIFSSADVSKFFFHFADKLWLQHFIILHYPLLWFLLVLWFSFFLQSRMFWWSCPKAMLY